MHTDAKLCR